jgi:hypothetical protein
MSSAIKVIHCGTGTAGALALAAILEDRHLELVGLLVHSATKAGLDAAEIAGLQSRSGVIATDDWQTLCELEADAVCYMMLTPDLDQISHFLASGKHVITTAGLMHPKTAGSDVAERIALACSKGNSALFTTGINPGFVDESVPLLMSQLCQRIDHVRIQEYADCGKYPALNVLALMGFGRTREEMEAEGAANLEIMCTFFRQSIAALAEDLGCEVDEVTQTREFVVTDEAFDILAGHIPAGTVAGQRWRWAGVKNGIERVVQETYWFTRSDLGEGYPAAGEMEDDTLWRVTLEGDPSVRCTIEPRQSFERPALPDGKNPSGLSTAMAAVNAISAVYASGKKGVLSSADLKISDMPKRLLG